MNTKRFLSSWFIGFRVTRSQPMLVKAHQGLALLAVAAALTAVAPPAEAATARPLARAAIIPVATLSNDGSSITARVRIRCQPNGDVWEAFADVTQGDVASNAGINVTCDGRSHIEDVTFPGGASGTFERGQAIVHVSVVDEDDNLTEHAHDTRTVLVH
jgi:hypothetical protein